MERTVPSTDSQQVELYIRTYYSLLRSSGEVQIRTLEEAYSSMDSLLHPEAKALRVDMSAFIYSLLRLPDKIFDAQLVVLGQVEPVFVRAGYGNVESWEVVSAPARRRRFFFDGKETLACYIVSRSDVDDILPMLTAFQIEWNKAHNLLRRAFPGNLLEEARDKPNFLARLAAVLGVLEEDLERLQAIWGKDQFARLKKIHTGPLNLRVRLLNSSFTQYRRATYDWLENIEATSPEVLSRPVYFVSSNTHSLVNLATGFALRHQDQLLDYLVSTGDESLLTEWRDIQARTVRSNRENFLYYLQKKFMSTPEGSALRLERLEEEKQLGITRCLGSQSYDLQAQIIDLRKLDPSRLDPRLQDQPLDHLAFSDALILNVDYPLGMAAYHILAQVAEQMREVRGVYILGKAATLNGVIGDVMIPNVVHDEQSENTFLFPNCFTAADVSPNLVYTTVLDDQKAVTVRGTFLQTIAFMGVFYREGYTDIEMEAGPFLSAVYEMHRPKRYPINEIVNLQNLPFDLGILHYASDKPLSKGKNLGAGSLSYYGMDPTYATSLAILRRIFQQERQRLSR